MAKIDVFYSYVGVICPHGKMINGEMATYWGLKCLPPNDEMMTLMNWAYFFHINQFIHMVRILWMYCHLSFGPNCLLVPFILLSKIIMSCEWWCVNTDDTWIQWEKACTHCKPYHANALICVNVRFFLILRSKGTQQQNVWIERCKNKFVTPSECIPSHLSDCIPSHLSDFWWIKYYVEQNSHELRFGGVLRDFALTMLKDTVGYM